MGIKEIRLEVYMMERKTFGYLQAQIQQDGRDGALCLKPLKLEE